MPALFLAAWLAAGIGGGEALRSGPRGPPFALGLGGEVPGGPKRPRRPPPIEGLVLLAPDGLGPGERAGLCNQVLTFLALVRSANHARAAISLQSLRWRADWKSEELLNHTQVWDLDYWHEDPVLPRIMDSSELPTIETHDANSLWRDVFKHAKFAARHHVWHDELEERALRRLRPRSRVRELTDRLLPAHPYGSLHARVELDLDAVGRDFKAAKSSLQAIYAMMDQNAELVHLPAARRQRLFVAIGDDVDNGTQKLLASKQGPWNNSVLTARAADLHISYLEASIMDLEICVQSDWFVGTGFSTFSRLVVILRSLRGLAANFNYDKRSLSRRCDDGRLWEHLPKDEQGYEALGWHCQPLQ